MPPPPDMEMGYFHGSSKFWINNRLDVNDLWKLVNDGEKVTFCSTGIERSCAMKRALNEESQASQPSENTKKPKTQNRTKEEPRLRNTRPN